MFLFYICPRSLVLEHANKLGTFHMVFLDQEADTVIVKINMKDELIEEWFCGQEGVECLPHPVIDAALPLPTEQMTKVASFIPAPAVVDGVPAQPKAMTIPAVVDGVPAQPKAMTIHDLVDAISKTDAGRGFRTRVF